MESKIYIVGVNKKNNHGGYTFTLDENSDVFTTYGSADKYRLQLENKIVVTEPVLNWFQKLEYLYFETEPTPKCKYRYDNVNEVVCLKEVTVKHIEIDDEYYYSKKDPTSKYYNFRQVVCHKQIDVGDDIFFSYSHNFYDNLSYEYIVCSEPFPSYEKFYCHGYKCNDPKDYPYLLLLRGDYYGNLYNQNDISDKYNLIYYYFNNDKYISPPMIIPGKEWG